MQKLHLVGFTTDHEGLILSARRGSRSGGYLLVISDALEEAVDELRAKRADEAEAADDATAQRTPRVESALSVREIQARLRQGRSVAEVARAAGVDAEWIDRFADPVLAERAQVISKVRSMPLRRARLGPSKLPIGDAVRQHLADRGVSFTPEEFAAAWTARQLADGRWTVRFAYKHRGRDQTLVYELDGAHREVAASNRLSGQIGYVAPPASAPSASKEGASKPAAAPPAAKRAVVSTGFRPDKPASKTASRSAKERDKAAAAMRKAAVKRAAEAERAAARRLREKRVEKERQERASRAAAVEAARKEKEAAVAEAARQTARAEAAKVAAAKRRAVAKKAAATAGAKASPAETSAAKPAPAKKASAKKAPAKAVRPATRPPSRAVSADGPARPAPATRVSAPPPAAPPAAPPARVISALPAEPRPTAAPAASPPRPPRLEPAPAAAQPRAATGLEPARRVPRPAPAEGAIPWPAAQRAERSTRPQFRSGLAEPVSEPTAIVEATPNGAESSPPPRPPLDRPRRTRPLRAT